MADIYESLIAWQRAVDLSVAVYELTSTFPRAELYGLTSQMRRSSVSVPSNIAEGRGRQSKRDYLHFLSTARGSLFELQTQLTIAERLGYCDSDSLRKTKELAVRTGKLLVALMRSVEEGKSE